MATPDQVATLRELAAVPDDVPPYTDAQLEALIDASASLDAAAAEIWTRKAAKAAELVDISEGGSSRKMGDIYEQALAMASHYTERASGGTTGASRGVVVSRLRR